MIIHLFLDVVLNGLGHSTHGLWACIWSHLFCPILFLNTGAIKHYGTIWNWKKPHDIGTFHGSLVHSLAYLHIGRLQNRYRGSYSFKLGIFLDESGLKDLLALRFKWTFWAKRIGLFAVVTTNFPAWKIDDTRKFWVQLPCLVDKSFPWRIRMNQPCSFKDTL